MATAVVVDAYDLPALTAAMVGAFAVARSNHKKVSMSGDAKLPAAKTAEGGEG